jgi:hypothetical protein
MKISKCTYSHPDQDGDFSVEAELIIENTHDFPCEFALVSAVLLNGDEVCIGGERTEVDDCFIDAKLTDKLNVSFWRNKKSIAGDLSKMKLMVSVTSYKLEYCKIGSLDCPAVGEQDSLKKPVALGGVAEVNGVSINRLEDNDEGDAEIEFTTAVRNISDSHIQRVTFKTKMMDQKDDEIFDDTDCDTLPSKSSYILNRTLYGVKSGKAKNSTLKFSASVAVQLDTYTAESGLTKESN